MTNEKTVAVQEEETPEIEEVIKPIEPPIDLPATDDWSIGEPVIIPPIKDTPKPKAKPVKKDLVEVRCPNCPWKAGLLDERTYCPNCNGTGKVQAEPLE